MDSRTFAEKTKSSVCRAITERKIIRFYYRGTERVVEPYICGIDKHDRPMLLGYQTEERDFPVRNWGWRLFELGEISYLGVTRDEFNRPRTALSPFTSINARMEKIYCSVEPAESAVEVVNPDRRRAA
jgi:predicted DNA-binding transcriptional regulator YafY